MATPAASLHAPAPVARWWSSKSARERRIVLGVAFVAIAAFAWWIVWQPMTRDIAITRAANARNAVALAEARRMVEEMAGLARTALPTGGADARTDLERVLAERNLRALATQQDWKDGRVRLVFGAVTYDALIGGLEALQRDVKLRVVEATLTARVEPGTVRAEVVLTR
jgi:type II secretory pathway component PulM